MVEVPLLENGTRHVVCISCKAMEWKEGKYYCEPEKLRHQPLQCPREELRNPNKVDPYAILKNKLRKMGR